MIRITTLILNFAIILIVLARCSSDEKGTLTKEETSEKSDTINLYDIEQAVEKVDMNFLDFAIHDTSIVDKIKIFNCFNDNEVIIIKNKPGAWFDEQGRCVNNKVVNRILKALTGLSTKGFVPENDKDEIKKQILNKNNKIEFYISDVWSKTWYFGHSTSDSYGTYMILDKPNLEIRTPVIMGVKGVDGTLMPCFFDDSKEYSCKQVSN